MKKSELRQLIKEELQNLLSLGDVEIQKLKKERSKYNKTDIRYKELSKKIGDLESDKAYGLPGSKAHDKFSVKENSNISKGRAKSSLKQKLKGKRDDGMGAFTAIVYGVDNKGKEHELKSSTDVDKYKKFILKDNPDVTFDNNKKQYVNEESDLPLENKLQDMTSLYTKMKSKFDNYPEKQINGTWSDHAKVMMKDMRLLNNEINRLKRQIKTDSTGSGYVKQHGPNVGKPINETKDFSAIADVIEDSNLDDSLFKPQTKDAAIGFIRGGNASQEYMAKIFKIMNDAGLEIPKDFNKPNPTNSPTIKDTDPFKVFPPSKGYMGAKHTGD